MNEFSVATVKTTVATLREISAECRKLSRDPGENQKAFKVIAEKLATARTVLNATKTNNIVGFNVTVKKKFVASMDYMHNKSVGILARIEEGTAEEIPLQKNVRFFKSESSETINRISDEMQEFFDKTQIMESSVDSMDNELPDTFGMSNAETETANRGIKMAHLFSSHDAENLMEKNRGELSRYSPFKARLPDEASLKGKPFVLVRTPVIGMFKQFISKAEAENSGFDVESIDDRYLVFDEQVVLGVSKLYVLIQGFGKGESLGFDSKKLNARHTSYIESHFDEYVAKAIKTLKTKTGKNYMPVADNVYLSHRLTPNIKYVWLMVQAELSALQKIKGSLELRDAGFPY